MRVRRLVVAFTVAVTAAGVATVAIGRAAPAALRVGLSIAPSQSAGPPDGLQICRRSARRILRSTARTATKGKPARSMAMNACSKTMAARSSKEWTGPGSRRVLMITIQHANPYYDHSYAVNSANLGPYGDAIPIASPIAGAGGI
jgi:hypothetical protein